MTEAGCQTLGMSTGFRFQRGGFFVKHYARNPYIRNDEEDWLFQDTNMVDRSTPAVGAVPGLSSPRDSEQGPHAEKSRGSRSPRETPVLDEDDQIMEIKSAKFYQWSLLKDLLFVLCCLLTGGVALIVCSTWPRIYTRLRFVEVKQDDDDAERVLIQSMDGHLTLVDIMWISESQSEKIWISSSRARFSDESITNRPRTFVWREERFWFNHQNGSWTRRGFNTNATYAELHSVATNCALKELGHDPEENKLSDSRERRSLVYGPNQLIVRVPNFWQLLLTEVFKAFFLFQAFSIIFWICSSYEIYAYVIMSLTIVTVLYNVLETRRNLLAVQQLAASECEMKRLTLAADETAQLRLRPVLISSSQLLPGDIVQIEAGMVFPCDLVLLVGQCVVNESMLTGESAPVPKTPLPLGYSSFGQVFQTQSERDGRYKLLSGTKVLQVRSSPNPHLSFSDYDLESLPEPASIWQFVDQPSSDLDVLERQDPMPVAAMVISTAYGTAKGQLVRAILFPKPSKYDFERKLYYFVANLAVYLVFVCAITVIWQVGKEKNVDILMNCINLITIAIPPALPLALSIGLSVSFTRLQQRAIYCINPNRIINAGRINTLCFDKTGTLTEDGLSLKGIIPIVHNRSRDGSALLKCGNLEEDLLALYLGSYQECQSVQDKASYDKAALSSLGMFYTLAASHSISLLDPPADPDHLAADESSDVLGQTRLGWKAWLCRSWRESELGIWYSGQSGLNSEVTNKSHEGEGQPTDLFVGDPLEVQVFSKTGWQYLSRPDHQARLTEEDALSCPVIWASMHPSVDTVIVPPSELGSHQVLAVLRRFDFDSEIRLMSSIVLELPSARATFDEARIWLLVKGAPESLEEVCDKASLPQDFNLQLQDLTLSGYRVLACGFRLLGPTSLQQLMVANRTQMEAGIIFSGFMVMENKLKSETPGVLLELAKAGLREVMVTGDNPLTAISVSRQCGPFFLRSSCPTFLIDRSVDYRSGPLKSSCILKDVDSDLEIDVDALISPQVDQRNTVPSSTYDSIMSSLGAVNLVVTGRAFAALSVQHDLLIDKFVEETSSVKDAQCVTPLQMILCQANIFSRMSPQNKLDLMRGLQDLGFVICMTGDGANDSGALKSADVGVSIASKPVESADIMGAGPSIAAPFNTKVAHIGVVRMILAEGRCALVNATVMFKYMYFYALIQATAVMVLYKYQLELSAYQYLWGDLGLVFPMVLFMPATRPRAELTRGRPESNLLAFPILLSVYGQSLLIILFQAVAQVYLHEQPWYENPNDVAHNNIPSKVRVYLNQNSTVSFLFSSFQKSGLPVSGETSVPNLCVAMALSQSFGMFRSSPLSNLPLIMAISGLFALCSIFTLKPMLFSLKAFSMVDLSEHTTFLYGLWIMAVGNSLLFVFFERYAVQHKSTEMDMRTMYDEEMKVAPILPPESTLHKAAVVLSGEGEVCGAIKPVMPDYFRVAKAAAPIWARLASSADHEQSTALQDSTVHANGLH